jgi:hypothetical protein
VTKEELIYVMIAFKGFRAEANNSNEIKISKSYGPNCDDRFIFDIPINSVDVETLICVCEEFEIKKAEYWNNKRSSG